MYMDAKCDLFDIKSGGGSTKSLDASKRPTFDSIWGECLFCGRLQGKVGGSNRVSYAHILVHNTKTAENALNFFGISSGYTNDVDLESPRNFIPLCGASGEIGTCHHEFDNHNIALVYNPFQQKYFVLLRENALDENFKKGKLTKVKQRNEDGLISQIVFAKPLDYRPYLRLLKWRAINFLELHKSLLSSDDIAGIRQMLDIGENESIGDDNICSRDCSEMDDCEDDIDFDANESNDNGGNFHPGNNSNSTIDDNVIKN
jgi:hypothetical protein